MIPRPVREILKRTPIYPLVKAVQCAQEIRGQPTPQQEFDLWEKRGRPVPPPRLIKQKTIREYGQRFSLSTLVETGTYLGDTVEASRDCFAHIISIELDKWLAKRAVSRFARYPHIRIIQGDSGKELPGVLRELNESGLFWLDGHHSGGITAKGEIDTPILHELRLILEHPVAGHVIMIDDAREFRGENDYPDVEEVRRFIEQKKPGYTFEIENDIIRIHAPLKNS